MFINRLLATLVRDAENTEIISCAWPDFLRGKNQAKPEPLSGHLGHGKHHD